MSTRTGPGHCEGERPGWPVPPPARIPNAPLTSHTRARAHKGSDTWGGEGVTRGGSRRDAPQRDCGHAGGRREERDTRAGPPPCVRRGRSRRRGARVRQKGRARQRDAPHTQRVIVRPRKCVCVRRGEGTRGPQPTTARHTSADRHTHTRVHVGVAAHPGAPLPSSPPTHTRPYPAPPLTHASSPTRAPFHPHPPAHTPPRERARPHLTFPLDAPSRTRTQCVGRGGWRHRGQGRTGHMGGSPPRRSV